MPDITPRNSRFRVSEAPERYWLGGDPDVSGLGDALSLLFPEGERFFIHAVRHYRNQVKDPILRKQIDAFSEQEAHHSREHIDYNQGLRVLGYDVDTMEGRLKQKLDEARKQPRRQLVVTCGLEHFTTIFAELLLREPELLDKAPKAYRELWLWHALEELEHTSVPYDVMLEVLRPLSPYKRYVYRTTIMFKVTRGMVSLLYTNYLTIVRANGGDTGLIARLRWTRKLIFSPGYLRKSLLP